MGAGAAKIRSAGRGGRKRKKKAAKRSFAAGVTQKPVGTRKQKEVATRSASDRLLAAAHRLSFSFGLSFPFSPSFFSSFGEAKTFSRSSGNWKASATRVM